MDSSGVSMPEMVVAEPSAILSWPTIEWKKPPAGPCVFGFTARSIEYLTSAAVTFRPLVNLAFGIELERVNQPVRRNGPTVGERGDDLRRAELVVDETREQAVDHRPVLPIVADRGVERRHVVLVGDDDRAALSGRVARRGRRSRGRR